MSNNIANCQYRVEKIVNTIVKGNSYDTQVPKYSTW
jgi:hypothetical protein